MWMIKGKYNVQLKKGNIFTVKRIQLIKALHVYLLARSRGAVFWRM